MISDSMLKAHAPLPLVKFDASSNTIRTKSGREYSIKGLREYSIRAPGYTATVDGEPSVIPPENFIFTGTAENGESLFLVKDEQNEAAFVHIQDGDKETMLVAVPKKRGGGALDDEESSGMMIAMSPDDYDFEKLNRMFHYGEVTGEADDQASYTPTATEDVAAPPDDTAEFLWSNNSTVLFADGVTARAGSCSSFKTIDVAILYDSSFCAVYGSSSAAERRIEAIVGMASQRYAVPGLCTNIRIAKIEGYCDRSSDPWRNVVSNNNLLDIFQSDWNQNRQSTSRDVAHFFSGTKYSQGSDVGLAYDGTVCNLGSAYGINWMTHTSDLLLQSNLFAHELGHNAGAPHFGTRNTGHIMNPFLNSGQNGFSSTSINALNSYLGRQSCLSQTTGTGSDSFTYRSGLTTSGKNLCLDLNRGSTTNGNRLILWECNGGANQRWTQDSAGYIRSMINTKKCIVTNGASLSAGTFFMIWDCIDNFPGMQYLRYTDSSLRARNDRNKCIDVNGNTGPLGAEVLLYDCHGRANQQWTRV